MADRSPSLGSSKQSKTPDTATVATVPNARQHGDYLVGVVDARLLGPNPKAGGGEVDYWKSVEPADARSGPHLAFSMRTSDQRGYL